MLLKANPISQRAYSPVALWHLLSLDAPTVAALWTWFIARCCGVKLPWTSPAAMFLAVWMLYAADRLLDARVPHEVSDLEERHRFHHRYRARFLLALAAASVVLAGLLSRLAATEMRLFAALGSLLFAYFFLIHLRPSAGHASTGEAARLPKEFAVGVFFSAAVFIPTVSRAPAMRFDLLPAALLLAAVCTLNCLYVYKWEHPGRSRHAHWTTNVAAQYLTGLCVATAIGAMAAAITFVFSPYYPDHALSLPVMACAASAILFLLLDRSRKHMQLVTLRALVDMALLTPLVFMPFLFL